MLRLTERAAAVPRRSQLRLGELTEDALGQGSSHSRHILLEVAQALFAERIPVNAPLAQAELQRQQADAAMRRYFAARPAEALENLGLRPCSVVPFPARRCA